MGEQRVTQWFPVKVKPAREGLYQALYARRPDECFKYRLWDGRDWRMADGDGTLFGLVAGDKWRGLAEKPHA